MVPEQCRTLRWSPCHRLPDCRWRRGRAILPDSACQFYVGALCSCRTPGEHPVTYNIPVFYTFVSFGRVGGAVNPQFCHYRLTQLDICADYNLTPSCTLGSISPTQIVTEHAYLLHALPHAPCHAGKEEHCKACLHQTEGEPLQHRTFIDILE